MRNKKQQQQQQQQPDQKKDKHQENTNVNQLQTARHRLRHRYVVLCLYADVRVCLCVDVIHIEMPLPFSTRLDIQPETQYKFCVRCTLLCFTPAQPTYVSMPHLTTTKPALLLPREPKDTTENQLDCERS